MLNTLWKNPSNAGLPNRARAFEITDYTRPVVRDPEKFEATEMVWPGSPTLRIANATLTFAYWAFPTYLWILRKPEEGKSRG